MKMTKKGFTLIELLIVITIIGILAVAFLPSLLGAPSKARDTQRVTQLQKIATVLVSSSLTDTLRTSSGCIAGSGDGKYVLDAADFGGQVPTDPNGADVSGDSVGCDGEYLYVYHPAGDDDTTYSYGLYTHLENWENGNLVCGTDGAIGGDAADLTTIVDASEGAEGANATNCFGILVQ